MPSQRGAVGPPTWWTAAIAAVVLLSTVVLRPPSTALAVLGCFALFAAAGAAGHAAARRLVAARGTASHVAAGFVFAALAVTLPATLLGHLGLLTPRALLTAVALLALAVVALASRRPGPDQPDGEPPAPTPRWQRALLLTGFLAAGLALAATLDADRQRPIDKLDDPSYHMIAVATWLHDGDLRMVKPSYGDASTTYYPLDGELLDFALLAPFGDSDWACRWMQLPFLFALLCATFSVARRLGAAPRWAWTAPLGLLTVPRLFPLFALSAGNDVLTAFATVAAVDALLALAHRRRPGRAVYFGAALGLLVGTKYLGLFFAAPLVAAAAALPWLAPSGSAGERRWRRHLGLLAACTGVALVAGGYTYLRNLVSVGNPFFPAPLSLFGFELPGWHMVSIAERSKLPEYAIEPLAFLAERVHFGKVLRWLLVPTALAAPLAALFVRRPDRPLRVAVLALPAMHWWIFLHLVHDHREARYLFAAVALATAGLAWGLAAIARRRPRLAATAAGLLSFALVTRLVPPHDGGTGARWLVGLSLLAAAWLLTAADAGALLRALTAWLRRHRRFAAAAAAAAAGLAALTLAPAVDAYQRSKYADQPVVRWIEEAAPDGAVVAAVGGNRWYALFGRRLQNRVEVVPTRGELADRHFTWGGHALRPYGAGGDAEVWFDHLDRLGVDFVAVHVDQGHRPERRWLRFGHRRYDWVYRDDRRGIELWRRHSVRRQWIDRDST